METAARDVAAYGSVLVRVQQVRWNRGGAELAQYCTSFHGKQNENRELRTGLFIYKGRISARKRVELNLVA